MFSRCKSVKPYLATTSIYQPLYYNENIFTDQFSIFLPYFNLIMRPVEHHFSPKGGLRSEGHRITTDFCN